MIELICTPHSVAHARELMKLGVDSLVVGEGRFGLRLPYNFSVEEIKQVCDLAQEYGTKVLVSCNAIYHNEDIHALRDYLPQIADLPIHAIYLGDPGVLQTLRNLELELDYIYDGHTLVTSSRHVNFWAQRGAIGAVMAREVPLAELQDMVDKLQVPIEVQVYGPTCIHQSKRQLLENYGNFIEHDGIETSAHKPLYLSEPMKKHTHYSIYEDRNGTHIFASNDLNLMAELERLYDLGIKHWKLDGLFIPPTNYNEIVKLFIQAKDLLEAGDWNEGMAEELAQAVADIHPEERGLDTGFFLIDPASIQ